MKKDEEIKITLNNKELTLKEFFNALNDIFLIANNKCNYCKKNNYDDKQKLELIKNILIKRLGFKG